MNATPLRIVFMGTPDFAVASLNILVNNGFNIVGVVTSPDKPAGRGLQMHESAVKKYALQHNLKILQPVSLKDEHFLSELRSLNPNLQIVVAFRMLPEVVWNMPPLGTFNLHASLLPQYRGAAPINHAIINGEKETGVTTFFLKHEIDTGNIIKQRSTPIGENETAGELHDKLMNIGAELVLETVKAIENGNYTTRPQDSVTQKELKGAPKIFKDFCKIDWNKNTNTIHNFIRGLSPYPAAWTEFISPEGDTFITKVFITRPETLSHNHTIGTIICDNKSFLKIACNNGYIHVSELQLAGKKRMKVADFLRGFNLNGAWKAL